MYPRKLTCVSGSTTSSVLPPKPNPISTRCPLVSWLARSLLSSSRKVSRSVRISCFSSSHSRRLPVTPRDSAARNAASATCLSRSPLCRFHSSPGAGSSPSLLASWMNRSRISCTSEPRSRALMVVVSSGVSRALSRSTWPRKYRKGHTAQLSRLVAETGDCSRLCPNLASSATFDRLPSNSVSR